MTARSLFPRRDLATTPCALRCGVHGRTVPECRTRCRSAGRGDTPARCRPQEYLPEGLEGREFYTPGPFGHERRIAERLEWWAKLKRGEAPDQ